MLLLKSALTKKLGGNNDSYILLSKSVENDIMPHFYLSV